MRTPDQETAGIQDTVWIGRGLVPKKGTLRLRVDRLSLELDGATAFDAPPAILDLSWPWYGFGCQFWAHAAGRRYFISFLHPNNTLTTWARGVRTGRRWRRALKEILSRSSVTLARQ